jgi:hypothetical protein
MARAKIFATALAVIIALGLSGLQPSEAQPGARFQDQGYRESLGYPALGGPYYRYRYGGRSYAYWGGGYAYRGRSFAYWGPRRYAYAYRYRRWW